VDTDHMSRLTRDAVLQMAVDRNYPLVSGHSGYNDLAAFSDRAEYGLTGTDLDTFRQIGGMVTIPITRGPEETDADYPAKYRYVLSHMGGAGPYNDETHPLIAFSTDVNGLVRAAAPRCPNGVCRDGRPALDYSASQTGTITLHFPG